MSLAGDVTVDVDLSRGAENVLVTIDSNVGCAAFWVDGDTADPEAVRDLLEDAGRELDRALGYGVDK